MSVQPAPYTTRAYLIQALSPLSAGTGQSAGIIDLPIARMRATGIPFIPGSSLKGALKDAGRGRLCDGELAAIFGPDRDGSAGDHCGRDPERSLPDEEQSARDRAGIDHAGALLVGDARLLALPVRSFRGTFALATSPLLLHLMRRDLMTCDPAASSLAVPTMASDDRIRARVVFEDPLNLYDGKVYLNDVALPAEPHADAGAWAEEIAKALPNDERSFVTRRLVIVDDETMAYLWETATQIDTRVRIDHKKTHTVERGGLWTEESLPVETLLIGLAAAHASRRAGVSMTPPAVLERGLGFTDAKSGYLQLGGKATIGRGRCALHAFPSGPATGGSR